MRIRAALGASLRIMRPIPRGPKGLRARPIGWADIYPKASTGKPVGRSLAQP